MTQSREDESAKIRQSNYAQLRTWIAANENDLRRALRPLLSSPLCDALGQSAADTCTDLLIEVTRIALETAERFDPARPPRLWLLGIARKVILQWWNRAITQAARRAPLHQEQEDDRHGSADLFERIRAASTPGADAAACGTLWVEQALALLQPDEARIIRLITLEDRDAAEAGAILNIEAGAARVRLHRALKHLRRALREDEARALLSSGPGLGNDY